MAIRGHWQTLCHFGKEWLTSNTRERWTKEKCFHSLYNYHWSELEHELSVAWCYWDKAACTSGSEVLHSSTWYLVMPECPMVAGNQVPCVISFSAPRSDCSMTTTIPSSLKTCFNLCLGAGLWYYIQDGVLPIIFLKSQNISKHPSQLNSGMVSGKSVSCLSL